VDAPFTGPIGEQVVFSNVVPEFGTIAVMILGVAIISIIAVTAKSRVIPKL
jgi:predicted secreted protein with PEFG-CTERM motif